MYIENGKGKQQKGIKMWEGLQVIFLAFLVYMVFIFFVKMKNCVYLCFQSNRMDGSRF